MRPNHLPFFCLLLGLAVHIAPLSQAYEIPFVKQAPVIDGQADDSAWDMSIWRGINYLLVGTKPEPDDFSGRFKMVWTSDHIYLLVEITDDILVDRYAHPLKNYWDDDALEIFIDEDYSGGNHLNNHSAFAYHVALDNQAVDINEAGEPGLFNHHLESAWKRDADRSGVVVWEVVLNLYQDQHSEKELSSQPISLEQDKQMGMIVAYCDADGKDGREHFMSSVDIAPVDGSKNRGYIDASVFEKVTLTK